jgi:hypothetical protein
VEYRVQKLAQHRTDSRLRVEEDLGHAPAMVDVLGAVVEVEEDLGHASAMVVEEDLGHAPAMVVVVMGGEVFPQT